MAGRNAIDLSPYKEIIIAKFKDGTSAESISLYLLSNHDVTVAEKTIRRRLLEWGVRRNSQICDTPLLRERISVLFHTCCLPDQDILHILQQEGHDINECSLTRIRRKMGLLRRIDSRNVEKSEKAVEDIVQKELDKGEVEGHSRVRNRGHIARDRLSPMVRKRDLEGVAQPLNDLQRLRGEYIIPGPNYLWSINGYRKLQPWGIEVYAAIDAYSRYIVWIYVGVSTCTAVNILQQYIHAVDSLQIVPQMVRAARTDEGAEAPPIAFAQHRFTQKHRPDASLNDCFRYGTRVTNQRITAWWSQLSRSSLSRWQDYFEELSTVGTYNDSRIADKIAMLAVYMPILRKDIHGFSQLWNVHSIRRQANRPNSVSGKPVILFNWPPEGVGNYGVKPDPELITQFKQDTTQWDIEEYLPSTTMNWCTDQLKQLGAPKGIVSSSARYPDGSQVHPKIYLQLRDRIKTHMEMDESPKLELLEKSTGAWNWDGDELGHGDEIEILDL
ncbi:hypothetical protein BDV26DRAFT_291905 [Aspergillus bertholletiae]|uniref:Integrase core domain-containing protein n=1 Tax=Aspergillus bertholletiae TaxID=1226010 RepID=A0A5N7BAL4_9EURO|nr:hypothetical protein BDV26DRAFT_291905 [Aspergillus bertholletiae]